ncbi:lysylphosphatidylglycerol synthase transmembrane domain-containing protein [Ectothiorhodospira lacustris]|uniref:lysylphosphatidylglycerol synthase transmembrane domain-containing protein n=1 Tax=Ectothiorhodospira lacustris TaxID=2899127 RepID=UPI001EE89E32|nr:lysylphosphatidylglycerol synthase transmembrane domain-containing protein [Ectothiorhodospira lacustris]MCG5501642.1 flippase-like domain-containing protein [Ectothiorhodospira lacustris]MCG5510744.1 flippase-like domain-containing protein [Ectothiorhodospira lacustris]MCG5522476.1 flippase-like domain-containing protein [Ectothiorhodospira lacustris]
MLRPRARTLVSIIIFLAFVGLVEGFYGWGAILVPWRDLSPAALLAAGLLTLLTYVLRAWRVYDFYRPVMRGRFPACLRLTLIHNLLNNLLPMRTGELSFPVLMARYFQVPAVHSVPVLLWFRLMDLHVLAAFGLAAVGTWLVGWLPALAATLLWLFTLPLVRRASPLLQRRLAPHVQGRWGGLILQALEALPTSPRDFWRAWAWTALNWSVKLAVFVWVLALFLEAPAAALWLAVIAGDLTSVLPVHGVGGAGTYEAGVMAALLPFGVSAEQALVGAVNLHLFLLGSTLAGGLLLPWLPAANEEK